MGGFDTLLPAGSVGSETVSIMNQSKEISRRTKTNIINDGVDEFDENYEYEEDMSQDQTYYSIKALQRVYIKPAVQL
jgi:hypothetical protein